MYSTSLTNLFQSKNSPIELSLLRFEAKTTNTAHGLLRYRPLSRLGGIGGLFTQNKEVQYHMVVTLETTLMNTLAHMLYAREQQ